MSKYTRTDRCSSEEEEGQVEEDQNYKESYNKHKDKYREKASTRGSDVHDGYDDGDRYNGSRSCYEYKKGSSGRNKSSSRHSNRDEYYCSSSSRRRDDDRGDHRNGHRDADRYDSHRSSKSSRTYGDYDRYKIKSVQYEPAKSSNYYNEKYIPKSPYYEDDQRSRPLSVRTKPLGHGSGSSSRPQSTIEYKSKSRSPNNQDLRSVIDRTRSRKRDRSEVMDDERSVRSKSKEKSAIKSSIEVQEVEMSDEELRQGIDDEEYHRLIKGDADEPMEEQQQQQLADGDNQIKEQELSEERNVESNGSDSVDSKEANDGSRRSGFKSIDNSPKHFTPRNTPRRKAAEFDSPRPDTAQTVDISDEAADLEPIEYFPSFQGCRSVDEFQCMNRIEEGTYGVVYRAKCKITNEIVALKRLKMEKEKEGFPITSLREINTLLKSGHENIVGVKEIVVGSNMDKIFIVMEYVEHDLKSLMESMKQPFLIGEVKTLLRQLLSAIAHLHDNWILHRDLKTSNLLLNHRGILKVGDFGLAREYGSPLKPYTPVVVTLWYRAPELLLETNKYSTPIDVWSIGCIFAEFVTMKPFFPGKSELNQLELIYKDLGTPNDKIWPGYTQFNLVKKIALPMVTHDSVHERFKRDRLSENGLKLLRRLLTYDPAKRFKADEALGHPFFDEVPRPVDPSMFPSWPAKSEGGVGGVKRVHSPKAPIGGQVADSVAGENDEVLMEGLFAKPGSGSVQKDTGPIKGGGFVLKF